jgi:glycosyltransferase involved in cell wall biosynthesis
MRVLIITPTPTHPTDQGNRARILQIANALKRTGVTVELLYYAIDGLDQGTISAMRAAWDALHIVPLGGFVPRRRYPACWGVDDWVSPQLIEVVRYLNDSVRYHAVIINYVWLSVLATIFDPAVTVRILDTHDAFGDRHILARAAGMQPSWFYTTKAEEARGINRADNILAIQPEEGRYFRGLTAKPVDVIEYAVAPQFLSRRAGAKINIGYIGSGNPWNVESVKQFDSLLANSPNADFLAAHANFLLFGGISRVIGELKIFRSMGVVDDIRDAYGMMDLVVNPMVGGTGLKIKTVEALAFGKPVLATKAGGAGLELVHQDLLHDDMHSLAGRITVLLTDPDELFTLRNDMQRAYETFYNDLNQRLSDMLTARIGLAGQEIGRVDDAMNIP